MPRRNNRNSREYQRRLGFNPHKYLSKPASLGRGNDGKRDEGNWTAPHWAEGHWTEQSQPFRGDIWFAYLGGHQGTYIIEGCRPVLIISNNEGNYRGEMITVIPITRNTTRLYLPTQMEMGPQDMARVVENNELEHSALLLDQITTIDKAALRGYVGRVKMEKLNMIDKALMTQLGMVGSTEPAALKNEDQEDAEWTRTRKPV